MKKTCLILLTLLLIGGRSQATHFFGAEIRYEYNGTNYRMELTKYSQCTSLFALPPLEQIMVSSAACGISMTRSVSLYRVDTLRDMYCPAANASCGNPTYPMVIVSHYADTVSLPPCSNWKFTWNSGPRSNAIVNIGPVQSNIWVEAFLNNTSAPNSSGFINNLPPFIQPVNALLSTSILPMDIDGDSVFSQMIVPQIYNNLNVTYNAGYSFTNPMGGSQPIQVDNNLKMLKSITGLLGKYGLAMRTYDYRNGQMVGYSSRDWEIISMSAANPKAPVPALNTNLTTTTCPGQTSSVTVSFTDSVATDSVFLSFMPNNNWTYAASYAPSTGTGSGTISWTTPGALNPATTPYFFITVFVRDNACPIHGLAVYNILVKTAQCATDSVWPGDANGDYIVNNYDPLAVALGYGSTGALRPSASASWSAQYCPPWSIAFNNNVNFKHADCDGNGIINSNDLSAITANYGSFHTKDGILQHTKITGLPDLFVNHTGVAAYPGATLNLPIHLGTAAVPMNNIFGLAANIRISGIMPGNTTVDYPVSWLGNPANTLPFTKVVPNGIDWAYARTDHQQISGSGPLSMLHFTIPAGTQAGQKIIITFQQVKMIDAAGNNITAFNPLSDTLLVTPAAVGTIPALVSTAVIVPNPSHDQSSLLLSLQQAGIVTISITDLTGRTVWNQSMPAVSGTNNLALPSGNISTGVYFIRISGKGWNYPEVLKWTKE